MLSEILSHPLPAIIILIGVLVLVHELGHFLVGRYFGVGVETFSIGFGPRIASFKHKDTVFKVSWIPLGGFVKFAGTMPSEPVPEPFRGKEFYRASVGKRAAIIFAGPFANFILAVVAFTLVGFFGIPRNLPYVGQVRLGGPADQAGLVHGDKIVKIGGDEIRYWREMQAKISKSPSDVPLALTVEREGELLEINVVPTSIEIPMRNGEVEKQSIIGIGIEYITPVVTIDNNSLAHQAGLQTGMKISQAKAGGETKELKSIDELFLMLPVAFEREVKTLELTSVDKDNNSSNHLIPLDVWYQNQSEEVSKGDKHLGVGLATLLGLRDSQLTVKNLKEGQVGSLTFGDRIVSINGKPVEDIYHFWSAFRETETPQAEIEFVRNGETIAETIPLQSYEVQAPEGKVTRFYLDIDFLGERKTPDQVLESYSNVFSAFMFGAKETVKQGGGIVVAVYQLVTGNLPLKALGGPIMIAQVASESAKLGWKAYLTTMALISINLGIINLFPIPVLDGGQLMLIGVEAIRRRRLEESAIENFQKVGFVLVLCLIVLSFYNDISRYWASMFKSLKSLF